MPENATFGVFPDQVIAAKLSLVTSRANYRFSFEDMTNMRPSLKNAVLGITATTTFALIAGCGMGNPAAPEALPGVALTGTVHGGQQPISGAHIYMYAAPNTGYGAAATSLMTTGNGTDTYGTYVTTSATGNFSITGDYTCTPGQQVYIVSYGGNPGLTAGTNNTAAILAAALGSCPSDDTFAGHISNISMNEVTTVAFAYAVAGYATNFHTISSGTSAKSIAGMANAFATAGNLASSGYGGAYTNTPVVNGYSGGLSGNGTVPQSKINTLANAIAACVNSTGVAGACTNLFSYTKVGTVSPTNTLDALINMAQHPTVNVSNITNLSSTTSPFQPSLSTAPNDLTLSIKFAVPNTAALGRAAVDGSGNVWITNTGKNSLLELSPMGVVLSGTAGFTGSSMNEPLTTTFDSVGNIYVANEGNGIVSKFSSSGSAMTSYTSSAVTAGYGIFVDTATSNIWLAGNNALYVLSPTGSSVATNAGSYFTAAIQGANGKFYSTSYEGSSLSEFTGTTLTTSCTGGGLSGPASIAQDSSGRMWIANNTTSVVSLFTSACAAVSSTGYTGGGINKPAMVAVDGGNNVWVANANGTLSELNSSGTAITATTGFTTGSTEAAYGVAIDASGNVWATDNDGSIYEFVGLGTPTATPLTSSNSGTKP